MYLPALADIRIGVSGLRRGDLQFAVHVAWYFHMLEVSHAGPVQ